MHKNYIRLKKKHIREVNENLNDCLTAPKTYRKILNLFLNNIKIPLIPPLLVDGEIVSNCDGAVLNIYFDHKFQ